MLLEVHGRRDQQGKEVDLDGAVVVASSYMPPSPKQPLLSFRARTGALFSFFPA
jgi:hypothetical protein